MESFAAGCQKVKKPLHLYGLRQSHLQQNLDVIKNGVDTFHGKTEKPLEMTQTQPAVIRGPGNANVE